MEGIPFFDFPKTHEDDKTGIVSMLKSDDLTVIDSKMCDYVLTLPASLINVIAPCWKARYEDRPGMREVQELWRRSYKVLEMEWPEFIKCPVIDKSEYPLYGTYFDKVDRWRDSNHQGESSLRHDVLHTA